MTERMNGTFRKLPVYKLDQDGSTVYYTPGLVALLPKESEGVFDELLTRKRFHANAELIALKDRILDRAVESRKIFLSMSNQAYEPECLMIYLSNQCNLKCSYCPGRKEIRKKTELDFDILKQGIRIVARNCIRLGRPMTVVFHGWGEPTFDFARLQKARNLVERETSTYRLKTFCYIATNGVMSSEVARYIAENFDRVGLSCDGPPKIQNAQRTLQKRNETSPFVERTARILRGHRTRFTVRTTITRATMTRQQEIAKYIAKKLGPQEIRFEAAYGSNQFRAEDAVVFFQHFQKAKLAVKAEGIPMGLSGSRLNEIHGPDCNIFKNVLNLTPGNAASACFLHDSAEYIIGDNRDHGFSVHPETLPVLKHRLWDFPEECKSCINLFHCVKLCPDTCSLQFRDHKIDPRKTFRCRLQLLDSLQQIRETADQIKQSGVTIGLKPLESAR